MIVIVIASVMTIAVLVGMIIWSKAQGVGRQRKHAAEMVKMAVTQHKLRQRTLARYLWECFEREGFTLDQLEGDLPPGDIDYAKRWFYVPAISV